MIKKLNSLLNKRFDNLTDILNFYKSVLPLRTEGYHQDEIGPIIPKNSSEMAEKFSNRVFDLGGYTLEMKHEIDWYATPTGDLEWNGGFVRHGHFVVMANEYVKSGNEKYAVAVIDQMLDYIEKVPVFNPIGKPYLEYKQSTWRPFEAAARVGETWPEALGKIINSKSMTPEKFARILLSIYEHSEFIRIHHWKTGNHAVGEVSALGIVTIFFQEFKESNNWRDYAINFLLEMWKKQFHNDYYTNEMSGGYHWVAMRSFFAFYEIGKKNGFQDIFPQIYIDRLIQSSLAEMYQEKPDYSIPVTNDSSSNSNRREQLVRVNKLFELPEIEYRLTQGERGVKPSNTSYFFEDARIGIMRSNWTENGNYLFFDMGRWGDNHMNEDQLNIELSSYGRNILNNCGRWRYTTSPDATWLNEARYFKTTASYNSLIIDGYSQLPGDAQGFMKISDKYDYSEGVFNSGYGVKDNFNLQINDITHKRKIVFIKPHFFIMVDEIITEEEHEAELIFHYRLGSLEERDGAFLTQFNRGNLILKTISRKNIQSQIYLGSKDPFRGWHCPYYDQIEPAPELSLKQKGDGSIVFNTLLFPIEGRIDKIPEYSVENNVHIVNYNNETHRITFGENGDVVLTK